MSQAVSLIATLLNEEQSLPEFLDSVLAQSRAPEEVVLVDGGSTDRSCEIIQGYIERGAPIKLLVAPGANRSQGRNIAIRAAHGPIIAASDAGCRLAPDWLERIVAPLECGEAQVAAGYYAPQATTLVERAIAAATVPGADEVNPATFLPSSRSVAFLQEVWNIVGGYPENTSEAEDTLFDLALKGAGAKFCFVPQALVYWRQHERFSKLFWQFYRYAKSDGQAGLLLGHYRKVFLLAGWTVLLVGLALFNVGRLLAPALLALTCIGYGLRYLRRSRRRGWDWPAALVSPIAMFVTDVANYWGFKIGRLGRKL